MTGHFSPFSPHFCRKTGLFRRCIYFVQKSNKKNCKKQLTRQRFCAIIFYVVGFLCKTNYSRGIAQLVEQWSPKPRVPSSILGAPAKLKAVTNVAAFSVSFTRLSVRKRIRSYRLLDALSLYEAAISQNKKANHKCDSLTLAPPVGLEPTTLRLTAACSTD